MKEEPVGLLQLIQVGDHLVSVTVEVLAVARGAVGLQLQHGEHAQRPTRAAVELCQRPHWIVDYFVSGSKLQQPLMLSSLRCWYIVVELCYTSKKLDGIRFVQLRNRAGRIVTYQRR